MSKADLVRQWFEIAATDLYTARHLFDTMHPKPLEIVCYHCQQAAEKALKGFLLEYEIEAPRTHDLERLCVLCEEHDDSFSQMKDVCQELTSYASTARYPGHAEIEEQDAVFSLREAEKIYKACIALIPELSTSEQEPKQSL